MSIPIWMYRVYFILFLVLAYIAYCYVDAKCKQCEGLCPKVTYIT